MHGSLEAKYPNEERPGIPYLPISNPTDYKCVRGDLCAVGSCQF